MPDFEIKKGGMTFIRITDNGCGIPAADRERVFERFYRASSNKNEQVAGNGLGLVIVQRIVSLHEGNIKIIDGKDEWKTIFRISLKL